jgi:hypothetical protein
MKPIPGFPRYFADESGHIWSVCVKGSRSGRLMNVPRELKPAYHGNGYRFVSLCRDGRYHQRYVHRLVLETFVGPCPDGLECRHLDGDKTNNALPNLAWGTRLENAADNLRHGARANGSRQGLSKLVEEDIPVIRAMLEHGVPQKVIGLLFGIQSSSIGRVLRKECWGHIPDDYVPAPGLRAVSVQFHYRRDELVAEAQRYVAELAEAAS